MYDVIIVGGGHNGLTCAAFLARAGKRVLVLEGQPVVGGYAVTQETVPEAPGFRMSTYSADHILTSIPRSIIDDLALERYGMRSVALDPSWTWLSPGGESIVFWRDRARTHDEIARFSRRDADNYDRLMDIMTDLWYVAAPYLQSNPCRVEPSAVVSLVARAARRRRSLSPALRIMMASPAAMLEEWFERDEVKTALGLWAVASMAPFEEPGSGLILSMPAIAHEWGMTRPVGGSGGISEALVRCLAAHGGEVRTSSPVGRVVVRDGRATGVVLETGERVDGSQVVAAVDPTTLLTRLLESSDVPTQTAAELRGMTVLGHNLSAFKVDVALDRRPHLSGHDQEEVILQSSMLMAPDLAYIRRYIDGGLRGELTDEIPMWVIMQSALDRTLVPPGSQGETLYVYSPSVPYELPGGVDWATEKEKYAARCLDILDGYAPGLKASVIGASAIAPTDLTATGIHKGNLMHVDVTLNQVGPWRPIPSLAGYRTPIDGLWHTGAGAHPMPLVSGWPGRATARSVLRALRSEGRWHRFQA